MSLLLHTCCGPCCSGVLPALLERDLHPTLYWNNPNIHPAMEYLNRLNALRTFAADHRVPLIVDGDYGLRNFTREVVADIDGRCEKCYAMRLGATAEYAANNGFDSFSTTLLVSPYQDHERIKQIGEKCAAQHGISFYYQDFRLGFRAGQDAARNERLYMQKYCGCIFSEEDRYRGKLAKQKRGLFENAPVNPQQISATN